MRVSPAKTGKSISQLLASLASFGLFVYFGYHLMHGDRGYFAWRGLEEKLLMAEQSHDQKLSERLALENRVKLLRPDSIDLDLLDERARLVLGFAKPEEKIIVLNN